LQRGHDAAERGAGYTLAVAFLGILALLPGCARQTEENGGSIVFRHAKLFGDPRPLDTLIAQFEADTGIRVRRETLPSGSDEQHLFYAINLQARSAEFDLFALDVVWVAEFTRAGWLRDLSHLMSASEREDLFPGALQGVTWGGRVYALPWFIDAGLLYYRKDLLEQHGLEPPRTWEALTHAARVITATQPDLYGFVWQGKQYEGLVCNALEYIWSFGGEVPVAGAAGSASAQGLSYMRALVTEGITPDVVTTLTEEPSRVIFGRGRAVFLRNWPYAWNLFEREDSAVRGKVGVSALPYAPGQASASTLGGWELGVNRYSRRPQAAERLAVFLASPAAQRSLALAYGYSPPRRSLYSDPELATAQPFLVSLREVFETARPRPVSPNYVALSQEMQAQFSAVLTGRREPEAALTAVSQAVGRMEGR
jgi:multiple sugar transport system substrate-binding protein